jgi:hypothetical protein
VSYRPACYNGRVNMSNRRVVEVIVWSDKDKCKAGHGVV